MIVWQLIGGLILAAPILWLSRGMVRDWGWLFLAKAVLGLALLMASQWLAWQLIEGKLP